MKNEEKLQRSSVQNSEFWCYRMEEDTKNIKMNNSILFGNSDMYPLSNIYLLSSHYVLVIVSDEKETQRNVNCSTCLPRPQNTLGRIGHEHLEKHLVVLIETKGQVQKQTIPRWSQAPKVIVQVQIHPSSGRDQTKTWLLPTLKHSSVI